MAMQSPRFDAGGILEPIGAGSGGIGQVPDYVDPESVSYALCRVPIGEGAFKREKFILLNFNLESCPALKRAKINTKKAEVKRALGEFHAELTFGDKHDATVDAVMEKLVPVFAGVDSASGGTSVSKLKADYEEMLKRAAGGMDEEAAAATPSGGVVLTRKTAAEIGGVSGADAMRIIRETIGPFNWALYAPSTDGLDLINAGSLSVPELVQSLKDDQFAFGLMRLGFGSGRFRRVKWVSLTWSGSAVGAVKRAKAMQARSAMRAKLGPVSVDMEVGSAEDLTLQAVIDKVKRAAVVDGDEVSHQEDAFSVTAFLEALKEEAAASAGFFGDSGLVMAGASAGGGAVDVSGVAAGDVITEMHRPGSEINWAVFQVRV